MELQRTLISGKYLYTRLFVISAKPILTYEPSVKDQTLKASHSLVISVNIQATPTATVKWFHRDKELYKGNGINIETEDTFSRLTIKGVRGKQSGTYKIVAENKVGKAEDDFKVLVKGMLVLFAEVVLSLQNPKINC